MEEFGVCRASEVVSAVLSGSKPRRGKCGNAWDYFVHGVGYTVVLPSDAQMHIDAGDNLDIISVFDLRFYLEGIGCGSIDLSVIREECKVLADEGFLGELDGTKFELKQT